MGAALCKGTLYVNNFMTDVQFVRYKSFANSPLAARHPVPIGAPKVILVRNTTLVQSNHGFKIYTDARN